MRITTFDTTLRDGAQTEGLSFSVDDKLEVLRLLDEFGIDLVEGGWPGSNPKDAAFFERAAQLDLTTSRLVAFGATRRAKTKAEDDANLRALVAAGTPVVALVGKSSPFQVREVLRVGLEENLAMISESVAFLKEAGREVVYDAEHFFDAWREDADYALQTLRAAVDAGADWLTLCDTNGGSLPWEVEEVVGAIGEAVELPLGIHAHDDSGTAVANSLAAMRAGCRMIQGTINGYGERCGNANLATILPNLELKMGATCLPEGKLAGVTALARRVGEIANVAMPAGAPYVGRSAFVHKGGIHAAAVERISSSYEHVPPEVVGNERRISVSELSGRGNLRRRIRDLGLDLSGREGEFLEEIKILESRGFHFESAEASLALLLKRGEEAYVAPFRVRDFLVRSERREVEGSAAVSDENSRIFRWAEATLRLEIEGQDVHVAAEGIGPIHALDMAFRKALEPRFPGLIASRLADYKVRILDEEQATAATTRVLVTFRDEERSTGTVGCAADIVEASAAALADGYEFMISEVSESRARIEVGSKGEEQS